MALLMRSGELERVTRKQTTLSRVNCFAQFNNVILK